jgi:polyhydroxyalkanoate synthesis regulator phasin
LEIEEVSQMYASVMTTKGPASKEEANRVIDQLLPQAQSHPGFKGVIFLLDEKGSKAMRRTRADTTLEKVE